MNDNDADNVQIKATLALCGHGTATQAETYDLLCRALRSEFELSTELREAIASALDASITGTGLIRLRIEAEKGYFKSLTSLGSCKRLLKVGHEMELAKKKGTSYASVARSLEGVEDVDKYGIRARKLFRRFLTFIGSDHPDAAEARRLAGNRDPLDVDDVRAFAFSRFCELESGLDVNA